jgi:hypothetical protein
MKISDNNEFEIWTDKALAHGFGQPRFRPRVQASAKPFDDARIARCARSTDRHGA